MNTSVAYEYLRRDLVSKAQAGFWENPPDYACEFCDSEQDKRKTCKTCGRSDCVKLKMNSLRESIIRLRRYCISETGSRKEGIKKWKAFLRENHILVEFDKNLMPIPSTARFSGASRS